MKFKKFLWTTMIGGVGAVLPLVLISWFFYWLYTVIIGVVKPVSDPLADVSGIIRPLMDLMVVAAIIGVCFFLGLVIRTRMGNFFQRHIEGKFLKNIPGYSVIKEIIVHFSGEEETPFSAVVVVKPFGNDTMMTGFVTDRNPDSPFTTVFVPTGPNPTSGNIYHIRNADVKDVDVKVDIGMKTVIGCGAGSKPLLTGIA